MSTVLLLWALWLQNREWRRLRRCYPHLWPAALVSQELPSALAWLIREPGYSALLSCQRACLFLQAVLPSRPGWVALLSLTVALQWRWRGNFNGGSDRMSVVLLLAQALPEPMGELYGAVQLTLSYWIAGLAKLNRREWRNGQALQPILELYQAPALPRNLHLVLGWGVMLWQLSFPLAWWGGGWFVFFAVTGPIFHLLNWRLFGLNRFFWIWLAAYPCLWNSLP